MHSGRFNDLAAHSRFFHWFLQFYHMNNKKFFKLILFWHFSTISYFQFIGFWSFLNNFDCWHEIQSDLLTFTAVWQVCYCFDIWSKKFNFQLTQPSLLLKWGKLGRISHMFLFKILWGTFFLKWCMALSRVWVEIFQVLDGWKIHQFHEFSIYLKLEIS